MLRHRSSTLSISAESSNPSPGGRDPDVLQTSMEFTAGGSLSYKGYKINGQGVQLSPDRPGPISPIRMADLRLLDVLGKGASSVVKKAEMIETGELCAVKILETVHDPELRKQLHAELRLLMPRLHDNPSPYIVRIFDAFYCDDDRLYIVLEHCNAGSLDTAIKKSGKASEPAMSVIVRQMFLGLCYLFGNGIQHRDIKPANVLLYLTGEVKISDFGSSKEDVCAETFVGTTRYMSPERLNGDSYSPAADVWSAGMVMLEVGFGEHPYKRFGNDGSFVAMIEYASKYDTPALGDDFSDAARNFASLCLQKNAVHRPTPTMLVNEALMQASHPFIAHHAAAGNEAVAEWIAQGLVQKGPLLNA
mmetsp:Transcript_10970/g.26887  ORF Transcript_10970/g.26887 Transcript_10970/m.26887 type:complete len:362 (+) Transcript_10970:36-1121(+)